jgi:spore germination protein YaaH
MRGLSSRIDTPGVRWLISVAKERTKAVLLSVLTLALVLGLVVLELPSSGAPERHVEKSSEATATHVRPLERPTAPKSPVLPPATVPPAPTPAAVAAAPPLAPHEIFGFAPYWSLPQGDGLDIAGVTTLAYFSIGINANGTLNESGPGWNGYESQALSTLITRAHGSGIRVVLTVNDFDQHSLDALTSSPSAAATLSSALIGAIQAKNLDGVNLDLEGAGSADQAGLTRLVTAVSDTLHQTNPHWQVTMDTYASSAGDNKGFYNVPALASAVDAFFVMQYSPNVAAAAQASSPLTSSLFSDLTTIQQYAAAVPAGKVILGTPFYGEDWPTTGNTLADTAMGPVGTPSDSEIEGRGNPTFWDPVTDSAWKAYQVGNQWHEAFFDDPTSLFQIAYLARLSGLGGVGIWALGMEGTDGAMLDALEGNPLTVTYATPGPPSTTTTTPAPTPVPTPTTTTTPAAPSAPTTSSGGTPAVAPGAGGNGNTTGAGGPTALAPSITGVFQAESLASIESLSSTTAASQSVTLCLVTLTNPQSSGCGAPQPPLTAGAPPSTGSPAVLTPPFPGATVAGVLSALTVTNDPSLTCLVNENQLDAQTSVSTGLVTPALVVWQLPDNQQYFYVMVAATAPSPPSSTEGCAAATLAFVVPAQTAPAVNG